MAENETHAHVPSLGEEQHRAHDLALNRQIADKLREAATVVRSNGVRTDEASW